MLTLSILLNLSCLSKKNSNFKSPTRMQRRSQQCKRLKITSKSTCANNVPPRRSTLLILSANRAATWSPTALHLSYSVPKDPLALGGLLNFHCHKLLPSCIFINRAGPDKTHPV